MPTRLLPPSSGWKEEPMPPVLMVNWRSVADSTACAWPIAAAAHRVRKTTKTDRLMRGTYFNRTGLVGHLHISLDGIRPKWRWPGELSPRPFYSSNLLGLELGRCRRLLLCRCVSSHRLRRAWGWRIGLSRCCSGRRFTILIALRHTRGLHLRLVHWAGVCGGYVVPLQLEVNGCHFQRHFVAGVHGGVPLGIQHVHAVIPRVGFEPAAQGQGRNLCQVIPVELGRAMCNGRHPR